MRRVVRNAVMCGVMLMLASVPSQRAEPGSRTARFDQGLWLLMVDDAGCVWCRKWDDEVGHIYERSPVGATAPLVRRQKRHPDLSPYEPLTYTPTFVLVRDGREVGRIVGYAGADFFWTDIERLVAKAGPLPAPGGGSPAAPAQRDAAAK